MSSAYESIDLMCLSVNGGFLDIWDYAGLYIMTFFSYSSGDIRDYQNEVSLYSFAFYFDFHSLQSDSSDYSLSLSSSSSLSVSHVFSNNPLFFKSFK